MKKWILHNFRITWPKGANSPNTWLDYLISDMVVRTILDDSQFEIKCWRIHRRWDSDNRKNHILAFHIFVNDKMCLDIQKRIEGNDILRLLKTSSLIENYDIEDNAITKYDGNGEGYWSPHLKKLFPLYIQGICETLLQAIKIVRADELGYDDLKSMPNDIEQLEDIYKKIEECVCKSWQIEGRFMLHHLNAIFGYIPTLVSF